MSGACTGSQSRQGSRSGGQDAQRGREHHQGLLLLSFWFTFHIFSMIIYHFFVFEVVFSRRSACLPSRPSYGKTKCYNFSEHVFRIRRDENRTMRNRWRLIRYEITRKRTSIVDIVLVFYKRNRKLRGCRLKFQSNNINLHLSRRISRSLIRQKSDL